MPRVKARDLRTNIIERGFERGVVHTLELALEELGELRHYLAQLSEIVAQCVSQVERMVLVGDSLTKRVDDLRRVANQGDDDAGPENQGKVS